MKNATGKRKQEHIDICLSMDISHNIKNGLESYRMIHDALPEISMDDISLKTRFLGKEFDAPIYISPLTGGTQTAKIINKNLAAAAEKLNIPMGVGSQRSAIEESELAEIFDMKKISEDITLYANMGAVQINYSCSISDYKKACDMISADALVLHLNPLQEAIQPEGNRDFSGLLEKISMITGSLSIPVIAKEVGHGISGRVAEKLAGAGVAAIDVAGAGGTSWAAVEGFRKDRQAGETFRDWGIPTAECIVDVKKRCNIPVIASGGIRSGIDIVKSISLGASICGISAPLLKPATESAEEVIRYLKNIIKEIRIAMFCTGARKISELDTSIIKRI